MGKFIVTTRPSAKIAPKSAAGCFDVINVPVTALEANDNFRPSVISEFNPDVAVFTSTYGVDLFFSVFKGSFSQEVTFIGIGNETAKALERWGKEAVIPAKRTSEGVVQLLSQDKYSGLSVALFVSSKSNGIILDHLQKSHTRHTVGVLYNARVLKAADFVPKVLHSECFGIVVTSSFEARAIFEHLLNPSQREKLCSEKRIFAIGGTTEKELRELGVKTSEPVGRSNLNLLLNEISKKYC